jgi:alkanesulfonate monooxygenase SsuD/methylene tetrahydromethanopterin reductase-like flavin-dependent oxidoreductase (luciferase family)
MDLGMLDKFDVAQPLAPREFKHPARPAENVAAVDILSSGRVQWRIGRPTPMAQAAFHADRDRSMQKMEAAVRT